MGIGKKRLLDIVVTHYNEPWEVVRPFFDMLGAQRGIDFKKIKVWFVQDGPQPSVFPAGYFVGSPIGHSKDNLEIVTIPHKGVSAARNAGMDMAYSDWICFCDCDDSFSSIYSLKNVLYILENDTTHELIWGKFWMNYLDKDYPIVERTEYNHVWIHNKYYRLDWLKEHDIRFCENLYMSEDSAFNNVVEMEGARIGEIGTKEGLYAWCRRSGSITLDDNRYYKNIEGHFDRNLYVLSEYEKRKHARAHFVAARTITDAWAFLTKREDCEEAERIRNRVVEFYQSRPMLFDKITDEIWEKATEASEREADVFGKDIPGRKTVMEWIQDGNILYRNLSTAHIRAVLHSSVPLP